MEVLEQLGSEPRTLGELVACTAADLEAVSAALLVLEQAGLVSRTGSWFERRAPTGPAARSGVKR